MVLCRQSVHSITEGEHKYHVGSAPGYLRHLLDLPLSPAGDLSDLVHLGGVYPAVPAYVMRSSVCVLKHER